MAAKIAAEFGIEPELVEGDKGIFDVMTDEKLIFSKQQAGRFPKAEEIFELLRNDTD